MPQELAQYTQEGQWTTETEIPRQRVVVTGIGTINPLGNDLESTWDGIVHGRSGISMLDHSQIAKRAELPRLMDYQLDVTVGGQLDPVFNVEEYLKKFNPEFNAKNLKRMSRATQLALAGSTQALIDAGIFNDGKVNSSINPLRFGSRIGTCIGGMDHIASMYDRMTNDVKKGYGFDALVTGLERVSTVPSMTFGAQGPTETPTAACATGSLALIGAYKDIQMGDADIMIAGGVDTSIDPIALKMFSAIDALTDAKDPETASRPFDRDRHGFVMAEGVAVFILESEKHALARGARIYAELAGYGVSSDADHDTKPHGRGAKHSIRQALYRSGFPDKGMIYFNAHGTGTPGGDGREITAIREVLHELPGNHEVAVSSNKGQIGHTMGASGSIETAISLKAMEEGVLPPNKNLDNILEEADGLNMVPNDPQAAEIGMVVKENFGFGGIGSATVWKPYHNT